jgi:TRAP-type C4-dicarboxylate transport system substrate-binding protein
MFLRGLLLLLLASGSAQAQTLRVVSSFPVNVVYTQLFRAFVDKVNATPDTGTKLRLLGGPEVVPASEQDEAIRSGTVDGYFGPLGLFVGSYPEGRSIALSNLTVEEMRARGGFDLLNRSLARKLNAVLLGVFATGNGFHIWLDKPPARLADGGFDLRGLKLRAAPGWRGLFQYLGAIPVIMAPEETYTALERGVVDGNGWTIIGVRDFSWQKFTKVRLDPPWNQSDTTFLVNLDAWHRLPPAAQQQLQAQAIAYETESRDAIATLRAKEEQALAAAGVQVLTMADPARAAYLAKSRELGFAEMTARDPTDVAALQTAFVK